MPQLDFSTYASQIFWMAVSFAILYLLMSRLALPRVREVLQHRYDRISSDLKRAEAFKQEAQSAQEDFAFAVHDAKTKASQFVQEASEKVKKEEAKRFAKLDENFEKQLKTTEQRVVVLRKESKEKLVPVMVDATQWIVEKLIGKKIEKDVVKDVFMAMEKRQEG